MSGSRWTVWGGSVESGTYRDGRRYADTRARDTAKAVLASVLLPLASPGRRTKKTALLEPFDNKVQPGDDAGTSYDVGTAPSI